MQTLFTSYRKAFTLLELILVMIVLGIVSSIGSSIIANIYDNYILQRATYRASLKTELAAQQIANLLSYRIPGTTIARNPDSLDDAVLVTDPTLASDNTHTLLEWIGSDNDSFSAALLPPWNGFCDVSASTQYQIKTPGSNLNFADTIISNLSNNKVKLAGGATQYHPLIVFRNYNYAKDTSVTPSVIVPYMVISDGTYNGCMGLVGNNRTCAATVALGADSETLNFSLMGGMYLKKVIAEHYKLAWSAYSIYQKPHGNLFDLKLCYNYQPWQTQAQQITGNRICPGTQSTLITNISVFKFAESGSTFRFKICAQENIGGDYNITICKEKAIIL